MSVLALPTYGSLGARTEKRPFGRLKPTSKTVDALMLMRQLPSGVDIEVKL